MSTPASSKPGSQEPGTPTGLNAPSTLADVPPAPSGTTAGEQNMTAVQILRNRGMHDAADVLEQALRSGNAGTDPVVVVNDPGSPEEGEGAGAKDAKDAMAEDSTKPLAKRRASARIAKQSQHATMSVQEMATKSAPKGVAAAAAAQAAASSSAAGPSTSSTMTTTTGKKGGRGKSPAIRSPITTTSKAGAKQIDAAGSTTAEPSGEAGSDLSWVNDAIGVLTAFVNSSAKQPAAGAPPTPDEAAPQMSPELLAALSRAGMTIEEALARDPTDKQRGYRELEEWVDGALDMYRPEFRPILFPMFLYFYLELVQQAHAEAAQHFFETYSPPLMSSHAAILNHLKSIKLPHILVQDEHAQRYLEEKYVIRMSRSAFGLLLGWLMEGSGGEAMGAGEGFGGEKNKRGRATIRRILNDRIVVDVTTASSTEVPSSAWTENTGLISALIPSEREKAAALPSPVVFNKERGPLKLGPAPLPDGLADEATRLLKEEGDADVLMGDGTTAKQRRLGALSNDPPLVSPELSELPPRPVLFKSIEVKKEVERLRDVRKRIRLEPGPLTASDAELGLDRAALFTRSGALPSVCAYTFHDAGDGPCSSIFSQDSSLMAAGFNESYVRIWSLKGDKLRGMRSDFNPSSIKDASSMKKLREKHGSTTRKLIGHSAPVYGLSFDPISGSAGSPKYLLSCSSDATTRLWSLETMSNVVVYRGHQTPIWDVEWSPLGIYFATASRDRTARLWSTDRVAPLRMFAGHMSDVDCVRFHPNSLYLATGSSDTTCRLWDVQRGACVRVFMGHKGAVTSMAMSPDGKYLASASTDQSIILWDLAGGRQVKTMTGHTSLINSLSFSACSSMLVSGSCDWTVRCWDVKGPGGSRSKKDGKDQIEVDGFGLASRSNINGVREEGKLPEGGVDDEKISNESVDLIATFPTKRTPILNVQFTPRNLCLVSGTYIPPPEQPSTTGP